ncbi:AlpA family transcriptional regulator [Methylophilus sp. 5]|uniref:helix-turn-helix transcriptional regulator n=1 Tax=Methylophilus sp. 5 TaxID=1112274 RepID=UPI0009DD06CC|nr:helix-turn-helix domain-containing protein [Methylophilus sp. 5]
MKAIHSNINPIMANFSHLSDDVHIRPKQAALLLGIGIATFWRLVSTGKLKTHKLTERTTTVRAGDLRAFMSGKVEG